MTIPEKYTAWLRCPAMLYELLAQLGSMDQETLHDIFYRDLAFGTGGLRGMLGAVTNRMNLFTVMKVTRGLGACLAENFSEPSCAVIYGSRIHSMDFAKLASAGTGGVVLPVKVYMKTDCLCRQSVYCL